MKKLLIALLLLALTLPAALADVTLMDGFASCPAEAAMTDYLAERLTQALQTPVSAVHQAGGAAAVNAFLALPAGEAFLVTNPDTMVEALTQYDTDQDMRVALLPVTCVAASGSSFYASPAAAQALPEATLEALTAYTEEHPYELFIARMVTVDSNDYRLLEATGDMYVDQNMYMDYEEAAQAAREGAPDLIVFSDAMCPPAAEGYVRLFSAEQPGIWQGVFVHAAGADALADRLSAALTAVCAEDDWFSLLAAGGYSDAPCPAREDFEAAVKDQFAAYVRYLTSEGLFFYEQ